MSAVSERYFALLHERGLDDATIQKTIEQFNSLPFGMADRLMAEQLQRLEVKK